MMMIPYDRRPIFGVLSLMTVALVSCAAPHRSTHSADASAVAVKLSSDEVDAMLSEANRQREAAGGKALILDGALMEVAQSYAEDMAAQGYFSHTSPSGQTFKDRLSGIPYSAAAENIAQGEMDVAAVIDLWMNSPGHRANLLDPRMKRLGVGHSGKIWVLEFAN